MPRAASDTPIAQRFVEHLRSAGTPYTLIAAADPPDFLLEPGAWLELSDIYMNNAQAKSLNSLGETRFRFHCSPDEPAMRLLQKLDQKLAKTSYQHIYEQRGPGFLLLTCQDWFFDAVNLARVHEALRGYRPSGDRGFFRAAYFEYRLPGADRVYEIVYPAKA